LREINVGMGQAIRRGDVSVDVARRTPSVAVRDALDRRLVRACTKVHAGEGQAGVSEVSRSSVAAHRNVS